MEIWFLQKRYWLESDNQMRIISGKFKGRSIEFIKTIGTRPLKDSVKESIFNILSHSNDIDTKIKNSNVLDLYSGVGSFGLECLSRDAKEVTFIEKNNQISKILKNNLDNLSLMNKSEVINGSIENYLFDIKKKYNIFFFDPPYADKEFLENLSTIKKNKIFSKDHIVIIHREKKSYDNFKDFINTVIIKQYGRSKIIFGKFI